MDTHPTGKSDRKTEPPSPPGSLALALLAALAVLFAMVAGFLYFRSSDFRSSDEATPSPQDASRSSPKKESHFFDDLLHAMFEEGPAPAAPSQNAPPAPQVHFSEILAADDACLYHQFKAPRSAMRDYFSTTSFARDYAEYDDVVSGYESATSRFGEFYLGLAYAHWLVHESRLVHEHGHASGAQLSPYKRSFARAGRRLLALARNDSGNAAPATWALLALEEALKENDPTMGISESELEEAKDYVKLATRFDSYTLDHLRKMAAIEDTRAVAFLVRMDHHRLLALPDWTEFVARLKRSAHVSAETRIHLAELIAGNAKSASRPSIAYGYSPLELKLAETLAENTRPIPTADDIDKTFPTHQFPNSNEIVKSPDSLCPPPDVDPYRKSLLEHMKVLREAGVELGLSL